MKAMLRFALMLIGLVFVSDSYTQEHPDPSSEHGGFKNTHRISMAMGQSYIHKGINHEKNSRGLIISSWMLDYDYWFADRWAVGVQSDILLDNFVVESKSNEEEAFVLERSYPIAVVPTVLYRPWKNLVCLAGAGEEFAPEGHFTLYRAGLEYGIHLRKDWELNFVGSYDIKVHAYDLLSLGIGFSRRFGTHNRH